MDQLGYLPDTGFKQAESIWIGHHHSRNCFIQKRFEIFHIHPSVRSGFDLHHFKAADSS